MSQITFLGLEHPDKDLVWNEKREQYDSGELDWDEFYSVINGNGHCNRQRIQHHVKAHEDGAWVREATAAYNRKKELKQTVDAA